MILDFLLKKSLLESDVRHWRRIDHTKQMLGQRTSVRRNRQGSNLFYKS